MGGVSGGVALYQLHSREECIEFSSIAPETVGTNEKRHQLRRSEQPEEASNAH